MHRLIGPTLAVVALCMSVFVASNVSARDDGRYAKSRSMRGSISSPAAKACVVRSPTASAQDVDWDTQDGRYRVRLHGEWIVVPEAAVVTEPNRFGPAVVWPYKDADGATRRSVASCRAPARKA